MTNLGSISEAVANGRIKLVEELVSTAIEEGISAKEILDNGLLVGMDIIGNKFAENKVFIPQVMIAAKAMNSGSALLKPLLVGENAVSKGRVCIGTIKGDQHDIGKNLVKMMMEGAGLEVIDLGVNVPPSKFVDTAIEKDCRVIACSALLTTTMNNMAQIVSECESRDVRGKIRIMVGGAPVTQSFCDRIGADCYSPDAASAAKAAVGFCAC